MSELNFSSSFQNITKLFINNKKEIKDQPKIFALIFNNNFNIMQTHLKDS